MSSYEYVTQQMMDEALDALDDVDPMVVPGVRELVAEFYNNDVLKAIEEEYEDIASNLTREACTWLLTDVSIQVYEHESDETLREAVWANVQDGTISLTNYLAAEQES